MILELIAQGLSREEIITIYIEQLGFTQSAAEFIYAIETGEIAGDVITVDEGAPDEPTPDR